jgi:hypothetical protein
MMEGSMGSVSKKIIRLFLADVVIILITDLRVLNGFGHIYTSDLPSSKWPANGQQMRHNWETKT